LPHGTLIGYVQTMALFSNRPNLPWHAARRPIRLLIFAFAMLGVGALPRFSEAGQLTVFAAASLKNAMDEVARKWADKTGDRLAVSLAGSSILARQIQQGAPVDVFISANSAWMDVLEKAGEIKPGSRFDLLKNSLVLIAPRRDAAPAPVVIKPGFDLAARLGDGRLAMALVRAVPAGIYGKAALQKLGLWAAVAPRVAQLDNVRAALALVAAGEAPFGIVYATDAAADKRVRVVGTFPEDSHVPIIYPVAAVRGRNTPLTEAFLRFLKGASARAAFRRQGFVVLR